MSTLLRETSRLIGDFSREYSMINLKLTISKQNCYCHIHRVSILKTYKHVYKLSNARYEIYMHTAAVMRLYNSKNYDSML